jgi:hypothetical protein
MTSIALEAVDLVSLVANIRDRESLLVVSRLVQALRANIDKTEFSAEIREQGEEEFCHEKCISWVAGKG